MNKYDPTPEGTEGIQEIVATSEMAEALDEVFWNWLGENYNVIEGGGTGDVFALWLALNMAAKNFSNFSSPVSKPSAAWKSRDAFKNAST